MTKNIWQRLVESTEGPTVTFTLPRTVAKDLLVALGQSLEVDIDLDALEADDDMGMDGSPDDMDGDDGSMPMDMDGGGAMLDIPMDGAGPDGDDMDMGGMDDVPAGEPDDDDSPPPKKKAGGGKPKPKAKDDGGEKKAKGDDGDDDDEKDESADPRLTESSVWSTLREMSGGRGGRRHPRRRS